MTQPTAQASALDELWAFQVERDVTIIRTEEEVDITSGTLPKGSLELTV
jgi:hypothetical protein